MKIKSFKCTCGHDDFFFADKGNQTGIFCSECGKWFKWADKDEKNLQLKSSTVAEVIDEISTEIKGMDHIIDCEAFEVLVRQKEILEILEKYKGTTNESQAMEKEV